MPIASYSLEQCPFPYRKENSQSSAGVRRHPCLTALSGWPLVRRRSFPHYCTPEGAADYDYDLAVIGGGSGGMAIAKKAASYGAKVRVP